MDNFAILCELFVPIYCIYYGFRLKKNPPKMGERGLGTKLAMSLGQEAWDFANAYGANLCLILGGVTGVMFVLRLILFGLAMNLPFSLTLIAIELIGLGTIMPLINLKLKKTFNSKK